MRTIEWFAPAALVASAAAAQNTNAAGTICRLNRAADRMILSTDHHERLRVALSSDTVVAFERGIYSNEDLRPGLRVKIVGSDAGDHIDAAAVQLNYRFADAIAGPLRHTSR